MNYNHKFHAGNFADIIKHFTLISIIEYYKLKDKPIVFFDSHAGFGVYDLNSPESNRSGEATFGIKALYSEMPYISLEFANILKQLNQDGLRYYPGSPYIISSLIRSMDRAIFVDKNELAVNALQSYKSKNIQVHNRDGFEAIRALLPTTEKRGVIIIDPAFESQKDFELIKQSVKYLLKSFSNATIIIWFPIKEINITHALTELSLNSKKQYLYIKTTMVDEDFHFGMNACGVFVINPTMNLRQNLFKIDKILKNYRYILDILGNC